MHKKIDLLNIGLIVLSLVIAVLLPFKLFLFSYAILGPLHYLTEINWLKDKNYFVGPKSKWVQVFLGLAILVAVYPLYKFLDFGLNNSWDETIRFMLGKSKVLILTAFFFSIGLFFFKKLGHILLSLLGSFLIAICLLNFLPKWLFLMGLFLPTIIHVYLFTALFMLYGSSKSESKLGYYGAALLLLVPFIIMFMDIDPAGYTVSKETATIYDASTFLKLNFIMTDIFGGLIDGKFRVISPVGLKVQIFIAFAYTYHYLNWFSKTSIIGWKKSLTAKKTIYILAIWAAAVGVYLYDFYTGLIALYFLSILHVFFEFPLNIVTIKELFRFKKARVSS